MWYLLDGREAWKDRKGIMSKIRCHESRYGVIETSLSKAKLSVINVVWQGHLLLELPSDAEELESGEVRQSESRICTWCLQDGHQAYKCPLMKRYLGSMPKEDNGIYRCKKCGAINGHPAGRCGTDVSYGYARGSEGQSSTWTEPSMKCRQCGGWGHRARFCPEVTCSRCNGKGHIAIDCKEEFRCYECEGPHLRKKCPKYHR